MSHAPSSFPRLSCPIPVQNEKSSARGDFPSRSRAVDDQTEGSASSFWNQLCCVHATEHSLDGWKGLRSRGLYSPATLRKQAPFPGNDQPGSQHGPRGHPAWWVLDLGYRKPPPDVSVLGLSPTKTQLSLPPRTVPTPLESPRLHCSCAGGGGGRKGIG